VASPSGTVTVLFTDIEGSTRLWEQDRDAMSAALARHDEIVREAILASDGVVFATGGDGFAAAFQRAPDALWAALDAQSRLQRESWDPHPNLAVRMAIHTGDVQERGGDYFGPPLNRCARLMAVGHGGQVLCSGISASLVSDQLPDGAGLRDLGPHTLRDLSEPEHVFQLTHFDLRSDFPPLRSIDSFRSNLPTQPTAFVGRDREVAAIANALDEARVVTLCGVGGVGKTRLALQVAAHVLPRYEDGAWLVELAGVGAAEAVEDAVAAALGVQTSPGGSTEQAVFDHLRGRSLLLVLDNCEHVLAPVAKFVDAALRAAPRLTILVTSREGLAVSGEHLVAVPSLQTPDADMAKEDILTTEAVRLFVERAQEVRSDFVLTPDSADAVAALSRRLDGIPLAIELAAARVRVMTPSEILDHLDRRFKLLTAGRRTAVTHHQTLQSTLDWSYDLLVDAERIVFRRLSVFVGDFALGAAEAVVSDEDLDVFEVADLLFRLVEKSLVVAQPQAEVTRYRLLETIRDYAWARLVEGDEADEVARRHCLHYLAQAELLAPGLEGPDEMAVRDRIEADLDNCRAALRGAIDAGDAEVALRLLDAFFNAGSLRSPYGTMPLEVARLPAARGHRLASVALAMAAASLSAQGEQERAGRIAEEAIQAAESWRGSVEGDRALCHAYSSICMVSFRDMEAFRLLARTWLETAESLGDPFEISQGLNIYGSVEQDPAVAIEMLERARDLAHQLQNPSRIAYTSILLASRLSETDTERAEAVFAEAIDASSRGRNDWIDLFASQQLALIQMRKGNLADGAETLMVGTERALAKGDHWAATICIQGLTAVATALGYSDTGLTVRGWCHAHGMDSYLSDHPAYVGIIGSAEIERLWAELSDADRERLAQRVAPLTPQQIVDLVRSDLELDPDGTG
jgi:predicted ATPase/class 3 adenylate cyclase